MGRGEGADQPCEEGLFNQMGLRAKQEEKTGSSRPPSSANPHLCIHEKT